MAKNEVHISGNSKLNADNIINTSNPEAQNKVSLSDNGSAILSGDAIKQDKISDTPPPWYGRIPWGIGTVLLSIVRIFTA